jgi:2-polyprenyl-3-methyl-5-hydroxy-6-metoxy-1,4-benzoquinol methylase
MTVLNQDSTAHETVTQADLNAHYSLPWERYWLARTDDQLHPQDKVYRRMFDNVMNLVDNPQRVIDLGCGIGIFSINLARRYPQVRITAMDLSFAQLRLADQLARRYNVRDRINFMNGNVESIPLAPSDADRPDHIVMTEVLEHLLQPDHALKAISRLSSPETRIILSVPQIYGEGSAGIFYRQILADGTVIHTQDKRKLRPGTSTYKYFHDEFTTERISNLLQSCGFQVELILPIVFKMRMWMRQPHETVPTRFVRRFSNLLSRAFHQGVLLTSPAFDRSIARLAGGRWAEDIIVVCRKG